MISLCLELGRLSDKAPIDYFNDHKDELKGVIFHKDNGCMEQNYAIGAIPTLLVFDKRHKLVARDPELNELKSLIDALRKE